MQHAGLLPRVISLTSSELSIGALCHQDMTDHKSEAEMSTTNKVFCDEKTWFMIFGLLDLRPIVDHEECTNMQTIAFWRPLCKNVSQLQWVHFWKTFPTISMTWRRKARQARPGFRERRPPSHRGRRLVRNGGSCIQFCFASKHLNMIISQWQKFSWLFARRTPSCAATRRVIGPTCVYTSISHKKSKLLTKRSPSLTLTQ